MTNKWIDVNDQLPTKHGYYQVKAILQEDSQTKRDLCNYNNCFDLAFWPNISSKIWVHTVSAGSSPWYYFPGKVLFWRELPKD